MMGQTRAAALAATGKADQAHGTALRSLTEAVDAIREASAGLTDDPAALAAVGRAIVRYGGACYASGWEDATKVYLSLAAEADGQ